jgi:hypothetical protein
MPLPGAGRAMSSGKVESQNRKAMNFEMLASFQKRRLQAICLRNFAPVLANPWQEIFVRKQLQMRMAYSAALREVERRHQQREGDCSAAQSSETMRRQLSPQTHAAARNKIANDFQVQV